MVAQNMFPPEGATLVALVMAVIIIPVNITTVTVVAYFTDRQPNLRSVFRRILINPLIIGAALGLLGRTIPGGFPAPIMDTLDMISRAALGMGLLAIGAGLRLADVFRPDFAVIVPTLIKLVLFPIVVLSSALAFGVTGPVLSYIALCAAVPTAMNGYVLARQMGGDAENYAVTVTLQTVISFVSIPLVLAITDQLIGG
ncbi:MAG: AEC family transporter [Ahrensia sp.]|nr:AEC family transporter [Ahrensia sp.]